MGQLRKSPKNQAGRIFSGARLCHEHKERATANSFSFVKKGLSNKGRNGLFYVRLLSFELVRTRTSPVLRARAVLMCTQRPLNRGSECPSVHWTGGPSVPASIGQGVRVSQRRSGRSGYKKNTLLLLGILPRSSSPSLDTLLTELPSLRNVPTTHKTQHLIIY
jgi:hypothetical protein